MTTTIGEPTTAEDGAPAADDARTAAKPARKPARWLNGLARSSRRQMAGCVGAGVAAGLLIVAQAALIAHIVHQVAIVGTSRDALVLPFAALIGVFALRAVCAWTWEILGFATAATVKQQLRSALYARIIALGPAYTARQSSGALAATMLEQVEALEGYFARYLPQMVVAAVVPLAMLVVVFPVDWVVGLIFLICAPLIPLFMALIGMGAAQASRRQFRVLGWMSGYFLDRLQGMQTLKLFGQAQRELLHIREISDEFRRRTMGVLRIAFLSSAVLEFFAALAVAMVALYVGLGLLGYLSFGPAPELTLFTGMFLLVLAPDFFMPLRQMAAHYHDRQAAVGASEALMALLDEPVPDARARRQQIPADAAVPVSIRGVSVAFDGGERPALQHLSLSIRPGEKIALVGESGAGKSTILNLLLGFVQPDRGTVSIAGVDLGDATQSSVTRVSAWVGQTPYLFHGTIRENIRMARPDADDAAIEAAARDARVTDFLPDLPRGLDTMVGERGFGLSGGQAQRVALARAVLKDAPLLLLDEPTANLDAENEALVLDTLARLAADRTVILATHNPAGVAWADRVIELADGHVVAEREAA